MQPFPRKLWARIQATAGSLSDNEVTGHLMIKLNYQNGRVGSWDVQVGEHSTASSS